jgi:CDP-2,3-bis-(O-geranylgeranyl)-sn-glycerol synthase
VDDFASSLRLFLLIAVANGSPVIATWLLGDRWAAPLDGGLRFLDGRPLLGPSKTLRGVIAAVAGTALAAPVLGASVAVGALMGAAAMAGDALSSFTKRRMDVPSSGQSIGLDQIPEALLPLLAAKGALGISAFQIVVVTTAFFALEIPLARLFHRLGVRKTPY